MQKLLIDLKKNPEVADLVSTMQPGDKIVLETSIKAKDDQTLTLTMESASSGESSLGDDEPAPDSDSGDAEPSALLPDEEE